jgi:hypothetical protein
MPVRTPEPKMTWDVGVLRLERLVRASPVQVEQCSAPRPASTIRTTGKRV